MDYRELDLPEALAPFARAIWRLSGKADAHEQLSFDAMPDGCVELIHRTSGRSSWDGEQPEIFAAGLCTRPAQLRFSGDAEFLGIRLWPWAWNQLSVRRVGAMHDAWREVSPDEKAATLCESEEGCTARLLECFRGIELDPIALAVPLSASPGEVADRSGRNPRAVQRWFASEVGMTPRRYMRLLRFQKAVEDGGESGEGLAQEAVALGYADQAHMARDFRGLSGKTAQTVRAGAKGPFIGR